MILEYKYQEIMEHIEVTPEMRERILRKLQNVRPVPLTVRTFQRWIPLAAAACLILVVGIFQMRSGPVQSEQAGVDVSAIPGVKECASLGELSELAGFPIPDIADAIPFSVEETRFSLLWGELAQAVYAGTDGQEISLRVSEGTEDNSGVYESYSNVEEWRIGDLPVTVKGSDGQYALAVWTRENRSYSIYAAPLQTRIVWDSLITAAVTSN